MLIHPMVKLLDETSMQLKKIKAPFVERLRIYTSAAKEMKKKKKNKKSSKKAADENKKITLEDTLSKVRSKLAIAKLRRSRRLFNRDNDLKKKKILNMRATNFSRTLDLEKGKFKSEMSSNLDLSKSADFCDNDVTLTSDLALQYKSVDVIQSPVNVGSKENVNVWEKKRTVQNYGESIRIRNLPSLFPSLEEFKIMDIEVTDPFGNIQLISNVASELEEGDVVASLREIERNERETFEKKIRIANAGLTFKTDGSSLDLKKPSEIGLRLIRKSMGEFESHGKSATVATFRIMSGPTLYGLLRVLKGRETPQGLTARSLATSTSLSTTALNTRPISPTLREFVQNGYRHGQSYFCCWNHVAGAQYCSQTPFKNPESRVRWASNVETVPYKPGQNVHTYVSMPQKLIKPPVINVPEKLEGEDMIPDPGDPPTIDDYPISIERILSLMNKTRCPKDFDWIVHFKDGNGYFVETMAKHPNRTGGNGVFRCGGCSHTCTLTAYTHDDTQKLANEHLGGKTFNQLIMEQGYPDMAKMVEKDPALWRDNDGKTLQELISNFIKKLPANKLPLELRQQQEAQLAQALSEWKEKKHQWGTQQLRLATKRREAICKLDEETKIFLLQEEQVELAKLHGILFDEDINGKW